MKSAKEKTSSTKLLAEALAHDEVTKQVHDSVEQELVATVSLWSHRVIVYGAGAGALILWLNGQDIYINPALVSLFGIVAGCFSQKLQVSLSLGFICLAIIKHALSQGCSASLVPAIYGFIPCAFGFLYRQPRAVIWSTVGVLMATFVIFTVDISGHCTSDAISPSQKGYILADRLVPLLMLILGNAVVLINIVKQSQNSLLLHAKAARSAAKLANVRRDVLHRVTHELRTPLNGIVGSVELLTNSETMSENDMENALTIKSCLTSIVRICDDVLMAAKTRSERKLSVFNLASCVDDAAEIFGATAASRNLKLKVEFKGNTTYMVRGMEVELRQVLLNLVGNAMKFTNSGSITIRVQQKESNDDDKLNCDFEIQDTGIGVSGEGEMLFEAFHQGEQGAVSRQHKGTGLGLTICRDFVQLMGGQIAVDGIPGEGSRFYFTLSFEKEDWASTSEQQQKATRVVICDSEKESATSCHSVVSSIAPSADVTTVQSRLDLVNLVAKERVSTGIVFLECDSINTETLLTTLSDLKKAGWLVICYCDYGGFPHLVANSQDAYAIFRRPLPLVRMGDTLRDALAGVASSRIRKMSMSTNDLVITGIAMTDTLPRVASSIELKSTSNESVARMKSTSDNQGENDGAETSKILETNKEAFTKDNAGNGSTQFPNEKVGTLNDQTSFRVRPKRESSKAVAVELRPGSKVVVVDDTPVNVKVLVKMISRSTAVPIVSCFDGQSAIELVESSNREDLLLFLMDWHMPGVCGLSATESIRRIAKENGGPSVFICMVTADIEGLHNEMQTRQISCEGTISKGKLVKGQESGNVSASESEDEAAASMNMSRQLERRPSDGFTVVDIVAEKPVTFKSIQSILTWFQSQVEGTGDNDDANLSDDD